MEGEREEEAAAHVDMGPLASLRVYSRPVAERAAQWDPGRIQVFVPMLSSLLAESVLCSHSSLL